MTDITVCFWGLRQKKNAFFLGEFACNRLKVDMTENFHSTSDLFVQPLGGKGGNWGKMSDYPGSQKPHPGLYGDALPGLEKLPSTRSANFAISSRLLIFVPSGIGHMVRHFLGCLPFVVMFLCGCTGDNARTGSGVVRRQSQHQNPGQAPEKSAAGQSGGFDAGRFLGQTNSRREPGNRVRVRRYSSRSGCLTLPPSTSARRAFTSAKACSKSVNPTETKDLRNWPP